jgi:hypothetical protein
VGTSVAGAGSQSSSIQKHRFERQQLLVPGNRPASDAANEEGKDEQEKLETAAAAAADGTVPRHYLRGLEEATAGPVGEKHHHAAREEDMEQDVDKEDIEVEEEEEEEQEQEKGLLEMLRVQRGDDAAIPPWPVRNLARLLRSVADSDPELNRPPAAAGDLTEATTTLTSADDSSSSNSSSEGRIAGGGAAASHLEASFLTAAGLYLSAALSAKLVLQVYPELGNGPLKSLGGLQ